MKLKKKAIYKKIKSKKKNSNQNNKGQIVYIKQIKGNSCILPRIRERNGKGEENKSTEATTLVCS
jgi:hypothetical protein